MNAMARKVAITSLVIAIMIGIGWCASTTQSKNDCVEAWKMLPGEDRLPNRNVSEMWSLDAKVLTMYGTCHRKGIPWVGPADEHRTTWGTPLMSLAAESRVIWEGRSPDLESPLT